MNDQNKSHRNTTEEGYMVQESWASAFVDGETALTESSGWTETVNEQLFYYTVIRQVLRGEYHACAEFTRVQSRQNLWTELWARIDAC